MSISDKELTMNILLVNPKVPDTFWSFKTVLKFVSKKSLLPPLGLMTVASMLPDKWEKKLVDMNISRLRDRDIKWADYVFISGMVVQKQSADDLVARCIRLDTKTVGGGPLFNTFPHEYKNVDHIIFKEAELTLPEFLKDIEQGCPRPFYNTHSKPDLSLTPPPMWELINMKKYAVMCVQYSRGCPFDCDFCDVTNLFGHAIRTKPTQQLIGELEGLYEAGWRGDVFFVDDNFIGKTSVLKKELLPALIEWMDKMKHPFNFNTQASINIADDEELMQMMVQAGFNSVFIGIESPDDETLVACNKLQNKGRDITACVKKVMQAGLQVQGGFIVGFDSDDSSVFDRLIQLIQNSGIVVAMVGLLNAPAGTKLYDKMLRENRLTRPPTGDNTDCTMNFIPKMDAEKLMHGYEKVVKTIYSQKYYCQRIKTFLRNYKPKKQTALFFHYREIQAFFKSIWHLGILGRGRIHYWLLLLWSMRSPSHFHMAVRLSIYGFHFRQTFKAAQRRQYVLSENAGRDVLHTSLKVI
jgi:radical SAM superfamily enzyme YgiQ (UPF0313 family)